MNAWLLADATIDSKRIFGPIDLSRLFYDDEKDQVLLLENPRPVGPWLTTRIGGTLQFLENGDLIFSHLDDQLSSMLCNVPLKAGAYCSGNVALATDEQFYTSAAQGGCIQFYRGFAASGSPAYSVCAKGYYVNFLDPVNRLAFLTRPSTGGDERLSSSMLMDMESGKTVAEWPRTEIEDVAISRDKTTAPVCRRPGGKIYFDVVDRDRLSLIDMVHKTVVYKQPFTCLNMPAPVLTGDGSRLIAAEGYIGKYGLTWHKLIIMGTTPPVKRETFDIGCNVMTALALSPDESMLAAACDDRTLRFLDPQTGAEIYRLAGADPSIWGAAFSRDGTMLATASRHGYISVWAVPPFGAGP